MTIWTSLNCTPLWNLLYYVFNICDIRAGLSLTIKVIDFHTLQDMFRSATQKVVPKTKVLYPTNQTVAKSRVIGLNYRLSYQFAQKYSNANLVLKIIRVVAAYHVILVYFFD